MSIKKVFFVFFIDECYIRSVKRYCFVRQYAAVPIQLEIVILQYIGWCVLKIRPFFFNQYIIIIIVIINSNTGYLTHNNNT